MTRYLCVDPSHTLGGEPAAIDLTAQVRLEREFLPRESAYLADSGDVIRRVNDLGEVDGALRAAAVRRILTGTTSPLDAPVVSPISLVDAAAAATGPFLHAQRADATRLRELGATHGFALTPLLERFLTVHDEDAVFRRWLDHLGFLVEVRSIATDWSGSDPCALALAGDGGGGDEVALYVYPPAFTAERSPPVVEFFHETNEMQWLARDFDAFFLGKLAAWSEEQPELATRVRERLGIAPKAVPEVAPSPATPPRWLAVARASAARRTAADAMARLRKGEVIGAERALVAIWVASDGQDTAASAALLDVYERLGPGWSWPLENLRSLKPAGVP